MERRTFLAGAAALAAVPAGFAVDAALDHYRQPSSSRVTRSDLLASAIGVNTHFNFADSVYSNTARVIEVLDDLGIRHVRDRVASTATVRAAYTSLAEKGIRVEGICGAFRDPETMSSVLDGVVRDYPDPTAVFSAFEGINEPNNDGFAWIEETRRKTEELADARQAAGLEEIPVVSPALARVNSGGVEGEDLEEQSRRLGSLVQYVDYGNIHVYPRMQEPSEDIDRFVGYARAVSGQRPMLCTEAGYFTAMNYRGGAFPTPPDVCATYLPRLVMEHWIRGNERVYLYELLDDPDPANADRESNFGMLRVLGPTPDAEWQPKPQYEAIKNLIRILADPGPAHIPSGLTVKISSAAPVQRVLVSRRNGRWLLLVWRAVTSYDPVSRTPIDVPGQDVVLEFDRRRAVRVFDPAASSAPTHRFGRASNARFPLAERLLIAEID